MPVSSATGRTSTPSWARCSRVPSVAKSSTSSACRPRAKTVMPSRVATESSARTRILHVVPGRRRLASAHRRAWAIRRVAREPSIPGAPAYSTIARSRPSIRGTLKLLPWDYFWVAFSQTNFPDLFRPIWIVSAVLLVVLIVVYILRTRALHRHRLYLDMWEWLFWAGLITFFLLIVGSIFAFDFAVILVILLAGLGTM